MNQLAMMTTLRKKLGMFRAVDVAVAVNAPERQAGQRDNRGSTAVSPMRIHCLLRLRLLLFLFLLLCFCLNVECLIP